MHEFDAYEYIDAMRGRWRTIATACAIAVTVVLGVSLLIPKRFTATSTIVIEPPGTNDLRTATAVSPVYLESLKTYERFAASDSLFARAVEHFHLQQGSLESLKRRVLKVTKPRDTKILEIGATLPDPKLAQQFAQFLAEDTVALSQAQNLEADRESIERAQKQLADARARLENAQSSRTRNAGREPVEALQDDVSASTELLSKLQQELLAAEADQAEYEARLKNPVGDSAFLRQQMDAGRARIPVLQRKIAELRNSLSKASSLLAQRTAHAEQFRNDVDSAQAAFESATSRLRELQSSAGSRGERLRLMDPGIVPQRPSSPNIPLNVMVAFFAALIISIVFLSGQFGYRRR